jgi:CelD/BcsL family acetyltransferase involved in cellulose biosynthesis
MTTKSPNFRQQMRRDRRRLDRRGAVFRMATVNELDRDLRYFAQLHYGRWDSRGGSDVLDHRIEAMLRSAARELLLSDRFRLWSLDIDGETISSHAFMEAGGELAYWLGGFDPSWASYKPSLQVILAAIEHAWQTGARRLDLGDGGETYKYRFAEQEDTLQRVILVPPGLKRPLIRARFAAGHRAETLRERRERNRSNDSRGSWSRLQAKSRARNAT